MENKQILQRLAQIIDGYLERSTGDISSVVEYQKPSDLEKKILRDIPPKGDISVIFESIRNYLKYSVRTNHPQYFNQLWGGFSMPAFLGEVISALTNTSMATYEVAPVATLIEKKITKKMCDLFGFSQGEGIFVTGASNANMLSLLAARNKFFPQTKSKGLAKCDSQPALFISDQAHYSFMKAANITGIGMHNIIKVSSDNEGRMIPEELDKSIRSAMKEGKRPFFVAATAGTTVKGAFDNFEEIYEITKKHNLWLHIDGALGGALIFSKMHSKMLKGINNADSFAWNAHKMMGMPLVCSMLFTREKGIFKKTTASTRADENYIFHENETSSYDIGPISLQCGRRVDSLKLWFAMQYYGLERIEERIDKLFELAEYAENKVKSINELELSFPRKFINICFRYKTNIRDIDNFNIKLRDKLWHSGKSMVNYAEIDGKTVIRMVTINPDIEFRDIDIFFQNLKQAAKEIINENKSA